MSEKEQVEFNKWNKEHREVCPLLQPGVDKPAIGGRLTFGFTPTGIGTAITVKCMCGAEKNLTDYECW